jgi:uncharacterized membrane protein
MYKTLVGQGWVTRNEFWTLHPQEVYWLIDAKKQPVYYGDLSEEEAKELYEAQYG